MQSKHARTVVVVAALVALGLAWWATREGSSAEVEAAASALPTGASAGASAEKRARPVVTAVTAPARPVVPAWLAQPAAPARRVAGRVTFEGQPVPGALVRLEPRPLPSGVSARQLQADAAGAFDFGLQPAMVHDVSACAPGRTEAAQALDLRDPTLAPAPDALELELTSCEARLFGHVLDSGGGPIAHARVHAARGSGVESNAAGEYALCLPPGNSMLGVEAEGYGAMRLNSVLVLGKTPLDLLLIPEGWLVGQVVSGDGDSPVADAVVNASSPRHVSGAHPVGGMVVSGPDGRFRLGVAPGDYELLAYARGAVTPSPVLATALGGRPGPEVLLRVSALPTLRGHVTSKGKPVPGAHVTATSTAGSDHQEVVVSHDFVSQEIVGDEVVRQEVISQEDGSFAMTAVRPGALTFTASPFAVLAPERFLMPATDASVELEVKAQGSLHGLVTARGKPVVGARVRVWRSFGTSGGDGRYRIDGLEADEYRVSATSERVGAYLELTGVRLADGEDKTLDLELSSAASISGHVVSEQGSPVVGALVEFTRPSTLDYGHCVSDADGAFSCGTMIGGGEYQAKVYCSSMTQTAYAPAGAPFKPVLLADGSSHVEDVMLAVKYERLSISGKVVDATGAPVPDAKVRAQAVTPGEPMRFTPWMALPSSVSDAQGGFSIGELISGAWVLQGRGPDGAEAVSAQLAAGATGVVITLRPDSGLEGTLPPAAPSSPP